jgi:tetratricopeptide (TPR) repeat protein
LLNWGWIKANWFKKKVNMGKVVLVLLALGLLFPARSYAQDNDQGPFRQAIEQMKSGNYDGAINIFNDMLKDEKYQQNPEVHFHLGLAYYNSGRYDQALEQFNLTQGYRGGKSMTYYFSGLIYEAKALQPGNQTQSRDLKQKALDSWQAFLRNADPDRKERIGVARKHIDTLKGALNEK